MIFDVVAIICCDKFPGDACLLVAEAQVLYGTEQRHSTMAEQHRRGNTNRKGAHS